MSDIVKLGDINIMLAISTAHAYQLLGNARQVGNSRRKFNVAPPTMEGPPEFIRTIRVQVNDLEWAVPFEILFWTCGLTTHQGVASILGLTYLYARNTYAKGYIEEAEKRWPGFNLGVKCIRGLIYCTAAGLTNELVKQCSGYDVFGLARDSIIGLFKGAEAEL